MEIELVIYIHIDTSGSFNVKYINISVDYWSCGFADVFARIMWIIYVERSTFYLI